MGRKNDLIIAFGIWKLDQGIINKVEDYTQERSRMWRLTVPELEKYIKEEKDAWTVPSDEERMEFIEEMRDEDEEYDTSELPVYDPKIHGADGFAMLNNPDGM